MAIKNAGLSKEERKKRARTAAQKKWENWRAAKAATLASTAPTTFDPPPEPAAPPAVSAAPEPPKRPKKPRMVKEFGVAHSYAEKRLAEAIKERAQAMGKVAMLNAEIPSLVQIIKALGNTPDLSALQDFYPGAPVPGGYQIPPNGIDPGMMAAPLPSIPLARGGGMGIIPDAQGPVVDEDQFLRGDALTGGGGWR